MALRAVVALALVAFLQALVVWQIRLASSDGFLTVEQLGARGDRALSFDRHYAMVLDFTIVAPFVGLAWFLCAPQWTLLAGAKSALISLVAIAGFLFLWKNGHEAHAHEGTITPAGWVHALFAAVGVWAILMVLTQTARPEPVLLLVMCIVVPAFLFTGTHMFLGLINAYGNASTFSGLPLKDPVAWCVMLGGSAVIWWYSYRLIPDAFWRSLQ